MNLLNLSDYETSTKYDRNPHGEERCILCGNKVSANPDHWVHLTDVDMIVPRAVTEPQLTEAGYVSKGLHPIGSSCKNVLPKSYIITD